MGKKILIADDDHDFVKALCNRLTASGYDVICVYEGLRVVEMAHKEKPDLILLDWQMPSGKGNSVMEFLSKRDDTRRIPVIILTGVDEPSMEEEANRLGARAFLRKPYDTKVLLQSIHEVLQWKEFEESISRD